MSALLAVLFNEFGSQEALAEPFHVKISFGVYSTKRKKRKKKEFKMEIHTVKQLNIDLVSLRTSGSAQVVKESDSEICVKIFRSNQYSVKIKM